MANPQKEHGYTPIANEVIEQLALADFTAREFKVVLVVLRKTWGWSKKKDRLSLGQIAAATGIKRHHVAVVVKALIGRNVLLVEGAPTGGNTPNAYAFNKDHESWTGAPIRGNTSTKSKGAPIRGSRVFPPMGTQVLPPAGTEVVPPVGTPEKAKARPSKATKAKKRVLPPVGPTKQVKEKKTNTKSKASPTAPHEITPKEKAELFFRGIEALMQKEDVPWLKQMLANIADQNPNVKRSVIWDQVRAFGYYWTEKNPTGKKERWEMQKTFEVERRLLTWFSRAGMKEFSTSTGSKGKQIIGLND